MRKEFSGMFLDIKIVLHHVVLGSMSMQSLCVHVLNFSNNAHIFIRYGMHVVAIELPE